MLKKVGNDAELLFVGLHIEGFSVEGMRVFIKDDKINVEYSGNSYEVTNFVRKAHSFRFGMDSNCILLIPIVIKRYVR
ncbi:hypothetical protein G9F71_010575 [Clostridium sp. FP2]|uniref:hypothetical protein n=1 Tax=Clostridium sp. FP2 TaxID=2724481 RepID=UPI0013E94A98|nr:hypothetical protein [Clostridium sp. FP2]MBZ9623295.1 hypothetical protein [Clostridium sp. FP2]